MWCLFYSIPLSYEEVIEAPIEADADWGDADESPDQLSTHMEEIPRAPSPAGHKHLVRIGTCDHCLGRLGGKKRFEQSLEESGMEIRNLVTERDSHLSDARTEQPLCPFCENLYEESELLADIIFDSISPYELSRLQLGARIPKDQIEHEEEMRKRFGAGGSDALKSGLVRVIAQHLNKRLEGVTLVNDKPQVLALIDVLTLTVELDIRAITSTGVTSSSSAVFRRLDGRVERAKGEVANDVNNQDFSTKRAFKI